MDLQTSWLLQRPGDCPPGRGGNQADWFKVQAGVEIKPATQDQPDLLLLILFGWYLMVLQQEDSAALATTTAAAAASVKAMSFPFARVCAKHLPYPQALFFYYSG